MIARIWRGVVRSPDTEYVIYVRNTGIEHYRSTPAAVYYPEDDRFLVECSSTVDNYDVD